MLVSHRKRFIYTKTIKTAGSSVEVYFEPYCLPEGEWVFSKDHDEYESETGIIGFRGVGGPGHKWYNHMSAAAIRDQLGTSTWDEYFKFCVIRNPFDRLVSAFHFEEHRQKEVVGLAGLQLRFKYWRKYGKYKTPEERFRAWLPKDGNLNDRNKYTINGELCVDYFVRQEQIAEGIQHVCEVLAIPFESERILRLNSASRPKGRAWRDYYDARTVALVAKRYAFEFKHFGYPDTL